MADLIDRIEAAMFDDDEPRDEQSIRLIEAYERANPAERAFLDEAFICLCGWSLGRMIEEMP